MESERSQDKDSVTDLEQKHLQDADPLGTDVEERSHFAQLCSECIKLFQIALKAVRANNDSRPRKRTMMEISLNRSYSRLKIWSDENGAADGCLDTTLAAFPDLQLDTLRYIVSISQTLTERLINFVDMDLAKSGHECVSALRSLTTAVTEYDSDNASNPGASGFSVDSFEDVLEDLKVDTTCLLDLEPLICSPILQTDPERTAVLDTNHIRWNPHQPYSDTISARFPMAAEKLIARLGKANYERHLRCQQQKATNELTDIPADQTVVGMADSASPNFHASPNDSSFHTTASTPTDTTISYEVGEGRTVRLPPLPSRAKEGLPFACVACGKWVNIVTSSAWKKHIYGDLEPWICLEADCHLGTDTFRTRNDWIAHLAHDHGLEPEWRMVSCPLCRVDIGPGKHSITRHMGDHLEEISLSSLPTDYELDEGVEKSEKYGEDEDVEGFVQRTWLSGLALFHRQLGCQLKPIPALSNKSLSLFDLNMGVYACGGYEQVNESKDWSRVCLEMGFHADEIGNTSFDLEHAYKEWISPYNESRRLNRVSMNTESNDPVKTVGPDFSMVTPAEKALDYPQLRELIKRVTNSNSPKDDLTRLEEILHRASEGELSRFQTIIHQTTTESKREGASTEPSVVTGAGVLCDSGNMQSKDGVDNPPSLVSKSGASAAQMGINTVASHSKDDGSSPAEAGDNAVARSSGGMEPVSRAQAMTMPGDIQNFIEQYNEDEDFLRHYFQLPNNEQPVYIDSEGDAPSLTFGQSLSSWSGSRDTPASAEPQALFSASWPASERLDVMNSASCVRCIGGDPEIHIQGPRAPSPIRLVEDDVSISLCPPKSDSEDKEAPEEDRVVQPED